MIEHMAVLKGQYLDKLLDGSKRIECRLMRIAHRPFNSVQIGQIIWFKRSGGWIEARAVAKDVRYLDKLTPAKILRIKEKYNDLICGTDQFWQSHLECKYATLIWLRDVCSVWPFKLEKPPRSSWVVLDKKIALQFALQDKAVTTK